MLKAENLSKHFGEQCALQPLNLEIGRGEIQCLLGANGAGKTTTINLFLGFLKPTTGVAYVNGIEVHKDVQAIRAHLAYVPEQVNLYPLLTGLENLTYFTKLAGRPMSAAGLREFFDQVGLDRRAGDMRVGSYSKGMRQKVGLAIALAKEARALLLDEPLSGLDPQAASEFCALVRRLAADGVAVLMVTHDLFRAKDMEGRIGIMKSGRLVENLVADNVTYAQLESIYLDRMNEARAAA